MVFKVILPDKTEMEFNDKDSAIRAAKIQAVKTQKAIGVRLVRDELDTEEIAIAYPTGMVQEGTGGFGFFKKLPMGKRK